MSSSVLPVANSDRFSTLTPDDRGGIIWTISLLSAVYSFLSLGVRCYIKCNTAGMDDIFCVAATLFGLGQFIAIWIALSSGLGKAFSHINITRINDLGKATRASQILSLFALSFAKLSVILLLRQLSPKRSYVRRCDVLLGMIVTWSTASLLAVGINCTPSQVVCAASDRCMNQSLQWQLIGTFDALTEILIVLLSITVIWHLQVNLRIKARVVLAFSPRLLVAVLSILFIHYISTFTTAINPGVDITPAIVFQQCELGCSLVSSTIPTLKTFIRDFDTGMGLDLASELGNYEYGCKRNGSNPDVSDRHGSSSKKSPNRSYEMGDRSKKYVQLAQTQRPMGKAQNQNQNQKFRPHITEYTASIVHPTHQRSASGEWSHTTEDSQEMIIRRDVDFQVRHD